MDGWMERWKGGGGEGKRWKEGWMEGWMDREMEGKRDVKMAGWKD